ncbi:MAG: hypothetical protein NC911_00565 [Candidatus Omnitrophica bacterium]|nr:hypothetical protein [Candidatus Omnitrophota bacterium]MCM8768169.1 hypothetical protein [Candidatus Omnitrophota bacterium]
MIYKEEQFIEENPTDTRFPVKQIEQLTSLDGKVKKFIGRLTLALQTPMGITSLPVTFEIEAATIQEAFEKFAGQAESEIEAAKRDLHAELQELKKQTASRIVPAAGLPTDISKIKLP